MDATTVGAVLAFAGVVSGAVVTFIGKRGESANSLTDQLQEELTVKRTDVAAAQSEITRLNQQRHDDLIRITQLEIEIIRLGGNPPS